MGIGHLLGAQCAGAGTEPFWRGAAEPFLGNGWREAIFDEDVQALERGYDRQAQRPVLILQHDHCEEVGLALDDVRAIRGTGGKFRRQRFGQRVHSSGMRRSAILRNSTLRRALCGRMSIKHSSRSRRPIGRCGRAVVSGVELSE